MARLGKKRFELSYNQRQAKRKREADAKKRDVRKIIDALDKITQVAMDSDAYHTGDVEKLQTARGALFAVHAGYARRVRR